MAFANTTRIIVGGPERLIYNVLNVVKLNGNLLSKEQDARLHGMNGPWTIVVQVMLKLVSEMPSICPKQVKLIFVNAVLYKK
jgi:hypothetical protein